MQQAAWARRHGESVQPTTGVGFGRILVFTGVGAGHALAILWMSLPPRVHVDTFAVPERAPLVAVETVPTEAPATSIPDHPRRPGAARSPRARSAESVASEVNVPADQGAVEQLEERASDVWAPVVPNREGSALSRPGANGSRPLRRELRHHLPGGEEGRVEGIRVREERSIANVVEGAAQFLFGPPRVETCEEVRQRLLGATASRARDMDVARLRQVCRD